jgi:diacylglycerol kinase (ATP)
LRVSVLYNTRAGEGGTPHDLRATLAHSGHEVVCLVEKQEDAQRVLDLPSDLVVAAGGDGTVAVLARLLAGRSQPMAILPLGTANNIALSLGIAGSADDVIRGWDPSRRRRLDVGLARGPWGQQLFVEGVGVGLIPAGITCADSRWSERIDGCPSNLARTALFYRDALSRLQAHPSTIEIDGVRFSGEFLLIEAFNMPFVGPNLVFAADANPSDGLLSIVFAREDQRRDLDEYLRHRMEGTDCPVELTSYRGRHVEIDNPGCLHLDDEVYPSGPGVRVSVQIDGAALEVLV